jgi:hypothetical protein
MESCGNVGHGEDGSSSGLVIMSHCEFLYTDGRDREMSSQGDAIARPAAGGVEPLSPLISTSLP